MKLESTGGDVIPYLYCLLNNILDVAVAYSVFLWGTNKDIIKWICKK